MAINNFKVGQTLLDLEFDRSLEATACRAVRKARQPADGD